MNQQWSSSSLPSATNNVFRIISLLAISFLLQWMATTFFYGLTGQMELAQKLSLQLRQNFHISQILTHPFFHGNFRFFDGLIQLAFTSLILYFFGSELERSWGSHNFLKYFLCGIVGAMVMGFFISFFPGREIMYHGITGGTASLLIAYAVFWPERQILFMFFIPMKIKWFIFLLFFILSFFGGTASLVQHSGGALGGALFLYYYARKGRQYSIYSSSSFSESLKPSLMEKWEKYKHKKKMQKKQQEIDERIAGKARVDELLEKISRKGISSLSRTEKNFLDKMSKEF